MSSNKLALSSSLAPPPSAYLSSAINAPLAGLVYVSGACGIKNGKFVEGTVKDRTIQALKNVEALLKEAGLGLEDGEFKFPVCGLLLQRGERRDRRGREDGRGRFLPHRGGRERPIEELIARGSGASLLLLQSERRRASFRRKKRSFLEPGISWIAAAISRWESAEEDLFLW